MSCAERFDDDAAPDRDFHRHLPTATEPITQFIRAFTAISARLLPSVERCRGGASFLGVARCRESAEP